MKRFIVIVLLSVVLPLTVTTAAVTTPLNNTVIPNSVRVLDAKNDLVVGLLNLLDKNRNSLFQSITKCVLKQAVHSSVATRSTINTIDFLNNPSVFAILTEHDSVMARAQFYLGTSVPIPS